MNLKQIYQETSILRYVFPIKPYYPHFVYGKTDIPKFLMVYSRKYPLEGTIQTQARWLSLHPTDIGKRNPLLQNTAFMVPNLKPTKQSEGVIVSGTRERQF